MSVPLARRLAGPSFSLNVRYDQAWMTKNDSSMFVIWGSNESGVVPVRHKPTTEGP